MSRSGQADAAVAGAADADAAEATDAAVADAAEAIPPQRQSRLPASRRPTRQRLAVASLLAERRGFASAQDLHAALREQGQAIGLATVYRTLQAMWHDGEIDMLRTDDGEAVYRQCQLARHHHHLVCRECRRTVEVELPGLELLTVRLAEENGFADVSHQVELFGRCSSCVAGS